MSATGPEPERLFTDAAYPTGIARWLAARLPGVYLGDATPDDLLNVATAILDGFDEAFRAGYDVAIGKRPELAARLGYQPEGDPRARRG